MTERTSQPHERRPGRPPLPPGAARIVRPRRRGKRWEARYFDTDGHDRSAGLFDTLTEAKRAADERVERLNRLAPYRGGEVTFNEWMGIWPQRISREPRTIAGHKHRIAKYVRPYLPHDGNMPIREIDRIMAKDVQIALLAKGYAKRTIDAALESLSAVLGYALEEDRIPYNPAYRIRVDPDDDRLAPSRPARARRLVAPNEFGALIAEVPSPDRAACWAPVLTGVRTQELFALQRSDVDRRHQLVLVHQRAHKDGGRPDGPDVLIPGLKGRRGDRRRSPRERGRQTLFPAFLAEAAPTALHRLLFPTGRGRVWKQSNFYRDVWNPARSRSGVDCTIYDCRHTFASRLVAGGVPIAEVAAYMGHSMGTLADDLGLPSIDNTTTRVYVHPTGEHRELALAIVSEFVELALASNRRLRHQLGR